MKHLLNKMKREMSRFKYRMRQERDYFKRFMKEKAHAVKSNVVKPTTLQLPITYKCNFDCAMCGMRKMLNNTDFTPEQLNVIIKDPIFATIESVGVNGGEPFLRQDLIECVKILLKLPQIKALYFISNGYFTDRILSMLENIKSLCVAQNVRLNISISVDGVNDMQDKMRGHRDAFVNAEKTCRAIMENKERYCDHLNIISTITKINVYKMYEVEQWVKEMGVTVSYNIATIHERIGNDYKFEDFSIFTDEHARHMAMEFFYGLFRKNKSEREFAIYYYIKTGQRIAYCDYQHNALTIIPNGNIAYCATHSKELGSVIDATASSVYYNNLQYQEELIKEYCATCSHYMYKLTAKGLRIFHKELRRISR